MASKQMMFETSARQQIATGLSQLARAVKATLGPKGRNVVLQKSFGSPRVTKDGATVLAEAIYLEGLKYVTSGGHNPVTIQRGILRAAEVAADAISAQSRKVKGREDYKRVATISANGDEKIGDLMADAMEKVGKEGVITVDEGKSTESVLEYTEGMQFDKGYLSPYFLTNPTTLEAVLENAYILLHEKKIANLAELLPLLNKIVTSGRPLLIIAEDIESEALAALVVNKLRGVLNVCAVKAPGFGDRRKAMMGDLAVVTAGANTETEMKERKDLIDDALHATKAAAEDGIVPGGGVAFLRAIEAVENGKRQAKADEKLGFDILAEALRAPARQIADNAGDDGEVVVAQILENKNVNYGYNAATEEYGDMFKMGIIDPAKVAKTALLNAASAIGLALTTDVLLTELKEKKGEEATAVSGAVV